MAFVKIDTGILDSTLWLDRDSREVFITALLMAEPKEFRLESEQLGVTDAQPCGWSAPPGWYGFVPAAGLGIVRRAGLETEAGITALTKLCSPELESRTPDFDGRRMIRISGGYLVLNYMRYRDKDHTAAARQQRLRDRKRHAVTQQGHTVTLRNITHADADADAYELLKKATNVADRREQAKALWPRVIAAVQSTDLQRSFAPDSDVQRTITKIGGWQRLGMKSTILRGQSEQEFLNAFEQLAAANG